MRAHTITTTARVGGRGRRKRTIVPRGILALSLAVVFLAATASTASAHKLVSTSLETPLGMQPASVGFGDRQVGTTSPAAAFTFRVGCRPTVSGCEAGSLNPRISVPNGYAQTNNCPPTLLTDQSCTINVALAPNSTGPKTGTLRIGSEGVQPTAHEPALPTATLTGNGVRRPTPPTPPLTLVTDAFLNEEVGKNVQFYARTDHDSTLVARGSEIEKTTKQLVAGEQSTIMAKLKHPNKIKAKLKHPSRLNERPKVKLRVAATDEFGQTATDEVEFALCRTSRHHPLACYR